MLSIIFFISTIVFFFFFATWTSNQIIKPLQNAGCALGWRAMVFYLLLSRREDVEGKISELAIERKVKLARKIGIIWAGCFVVSLAMLGGKAQYDFSPGCPRGSQGPNCR